MTAIVPGETTGENRPRMLGRIVKQWSYETRPRAEFRRRGTARPDHRRRAPLRRRTSLAGAEVPDFDDVSYSSADPRRSRIRDMAQRFDLAADRGGLGSVAVDRSADRQRPSAASRRGATTVREEAPPDGAVWPSRGRRAATVPDGETPRTRTPNAHRATAGRRESG